MVFIESPWFDVWRSKNLSDAAFDALQNTLFVEPHAGDLIPASGGLRKLRIALTGRGKRGGARVIYYYWLDRDCVYLLFAFAKNARSDLTKDQVRRLGAAMREELDDG